jgi:N-acetylglucosamine-6-phosphate deacetylase
MSAQQAIAADHVFDGAVVHRNAAVVIDGTQIAGIVPRTELPSTMAVRAFDGAWLAPGFIDIQVNGGGDVLFNDSPTPEGIATIAAAHRRFGTTGLLPTLISDTPEKMRAGLAAVDAIMAREPGVLGIHLEGPFLSPEKPGVHDLRVIRKPTREDAALLTAPRQGVTLVTLAPEQVPAGFIAALVGAGVRVSLGHSMATYAQTQTAMAEGLSGFTHLFNAMRPLTSRDPGPIAAALESPDASFGMIVDAVHVDPAVLRLALRGLARPILVTDAMPPVGGKRPTFTLYGEEMVVHDGRCTRRDGTLAGACLDMATAVRNAVRLLGIALEDALRMASTHPADFLGLGHVLGRLARGHRADVVALDPTKVHVLDTWVAGQPSAAD